ncbi:uncharacterized protein [Aegilops tauschii subsp. strangulata]|uniref:uncharacterized protein isoform X1 n=1 Tax=Aegilops tauschii subsp. strangulata TaxID=200361 RepID=UPI00098B1FBC|nr:uncharacterized protein LOC109762137 isoform X1 [Aegilops tauschii subsp. strangulata]XP_020176544.1 uncharacterized protein LOC109762137 isoform X1 [Aegilops tauschii subsp. strangulata]XP_020176545.1 uncharacterized protein LOC109762137 isoform X1 [Aegilops tauschii subsp. strangulata]XP_020176546.1 uncharacterized protein LOC109762137 isoform X1 [Aegilops tauschii subsp. strangulata]XP_020176547.1 uncharacterized protein LOC109762137 isoform X1 [Aegilops tauschii subsp. strangulata]XP_02
MRRFVDAQQSLQTAMLNNVNSSGSLDWSWYMIHLKLGLGTGYILSWSSSLSRWRCVYVYMCSGDRRTIWWCVRAAASSSGCSNSHLQYNFFQRGGDWGTVECDRVCADGPPQRHRPDPALQCTARSSCIDAPGVHVALLPCYPYRPRLCRRSSLLFSGFNKKSPCCHCILSSRDSLGAFYTILLMMPSLDATAMLVVLVLPFTYCSLFYFIEIHRNKLYSVRRFYN